jgi:hypothetical protein
MELIASEVVASSKKPQACAGRPAAEFPLKSHSKLRLYNRQGNDRETIVRAHPRGVKPLPHVGAG